MEFFFQKPSGSNPGQLALGGSACAGACLPELLQLFCDLEGNFPIMD